jgi:hypothetical protein
MGKIADLMTRAVTENVFPGAVLLVSVGGEILFLRHTERQTLFPAKR